VVFVAGSVQVTVFGDVADVVVPHCWGEVSDDDVL
jgi:hypothetical protein